MKFRKKPVEVEAYQITRSLLAGALFDGQNYPTGLKCVRSSCHPPSRFISEWVGEVVTIHGQATKVIEGDWIITEPDGVHFYPCKPDIFEKTYESPVEEPLVKGERDPKQLYTYYEVELKNINEEWDTTICESLDDVKNILEYLDIHLDDATELPDGEKRQVVITGIGMTPEAFKNWKAEHL